MSAQDVELARRFHLGGSDMKALVDEPGLLESVFERFFTPDGEWVLAERGEFTGLFGVYRKAEDFRAALRDYLDAFVEYEWVTERFIDAGDCVVVLGHERGTTATAGAQVGTEAATVFRFRDGRIARLEAYQSHERGLRAAGMDPADRPPGAPDR